MKMTCDSRHEQCEVSLLLSAAYWQSTFFTQSVVATQSVVVVIEALIVLSRCCRYTCTCSYVLLTLGTHSQRG